MIYRYIALNVQGPYHIISHLQIAYHRGCGGGRVAPQGPPTLPHPTTHNHGMHTGATHITRTHVSVVVCARVDGRVDGCARAQGRGHRHDQKATQARMSARRHTRTVGHTGYTLYKGEMHGEKKMRFVREKNLGVLWGAMVRDISIYIVLLRCVILTFQYLDITHLSFKLKYIVSLL